MSNVGDADLFAFMFNGKVVKFVSRYRDPLPEALYALVISVGSLLDDLCLSFPETSFSSALQDQDEGQSGDPLCSRLAQADVDSGLYQIIQVFGLGDRFTILLHGR